MEAETILRKSNQRKKEGERDEDARKWILRKIRTIVSNKKEGDRKLREGEEMIEDKGTESHLTRRLMSQRICDWI